MHILGAPVGITDKWRLENTFGCIWLYLQSHFNKDQFQSFLGLFRAFFFKLILSKLIVHSEVLQFLGWEEVPYCEAVSPSLSIQGCAEKGRENSCTVLGWQQLLLALHGQ